MSSAQDQLLKQIAEVRFMANECRDLAVVNVLDACRDHIVRTFVVEEGDPLAVLTARQRDIVQLFAKGVAPHKIAEMLDLEQSTVANFKFMARKRLGIETDMDLVLLLVRHGLVVP